MPHVRVGPQPRSVRDPGRLLAAWRHWCAARGVSAEPDADFRSRWSWWDTPDGRLHRDGTQLVERRAPGQPARVELHRGESRRSLADTTVAARIARGPLLVPLLGTSSHRRTWIAPGGGHLEWQDWTLPDGRIVGTVALVEPGPELVRWWAAARTSSALGRPGTAPSWPDHATAAVRQGLCGSSDDLALELVAGIVLARELATEDSPVAPPLLDAVHARLEAVLAAPSGACAASHPAWAEGLCRSLEGFPRRRPALATAASALLRQEPWADDTVDPGRRSAQVRALAAVLRALRSHLDAPTGKLRRRLSALAEALERWARLEASDAWLAGLGGSERAPLDADARLETGARRHRLGSAIEAARADVGSASGQLPRGRIRRLRRELPDASPVAADSSVPPESVGPREAQGGP